MSREIVINYNGHRTSVTCLTNDVYYVQITNSPYKIIKMPGDSGNDTWLEMDTRLPTNLSTTLGSLIAEELALNGSSGD